MDLKATILKDKDNQSAVLLLQLGIIFKLYRFPQNSWRLNLRNVIYHLLANIKQRPQLGIQLE